MIKVTKRREYELYIKGILKNNYVMTNKTRSAMLQVAMRCFDDGVAFCMDELEVDDG